jgi:hypothetical protein
VKIILGILSSSILSRRPSQLTSVISIHSNWFVIMEVEIFIVLYLSCL